MKTESYRIADEVIVLPESEGRWVALNVAARSAIGIDSDGLAFLARVAGGEAQSLDSTMEPSIWEAWRFPNSDGLLADPTWYARDAASWREKPIEDANDLLRALEDQCILVRDEVAYEGKFADKESILDQEHFGNFHQQLARDLMVDKRIKPSDWWLTQKFEDDTSAVKANLYDAVQAAHLARYIPDTFGKGDRVLDLGCGIGYYTELIAETGATVTGADPSEEYISRAKERSGGRVDYRCLPVGEEGALSDLDSGCADYVFLSDVLLFYFTPPFPEFAARLDVLLADITRLLKPGGVVVSIEPHYLFWLQPWLGHPDRPFTILAEYSEKQFGVVPTLGRFVQRFCEGGFYVRWMEEVYPDPSFREVDTRAFGFASEFPLWQHFEFVKGNDRRPRTKEDS